MTSAPTLGLGATALRAYLAKRKSAGLLYTGRWLASKIDVTPSAVHEWLTAGWLVGGSVPKARPRRALADLFEDPGLSDLFDEDDNRRASYAREQRLAARREAA